MRQRELDKSMPMKVSIHAPVWGATRWQPVSSATQAMFQSTHPCGVRLDNNDISVKTYAFQSTHPCGVRLNFAIVRLFARVSIHAPVWGATVQSNPVKSDLAFQSTHPCGVRLYWLHIRGDSMVSIHAPVWGATNIGASTITNWAFQSTHPCGVRPTVKQLRPRQWLFQSTHPCGVRRRDPCSVQYPCCFNPRTRVGCDFRLAKGRCGYCKFQSTHPCGVRLATLMAQARLAFQSTHPCGVRRLIICSNFINGCFNPRTRVGCDGLGFSHRHK